MGRIGPATLRLAVLVLLVTSCRDTGAESTRMPGPRSVADAPATCFGSDGRAIDRNPAWSPDGTQILFSSTRGGDGNLNLWVMDADGTNLRALTRDTAADNVNLPGSAWAAATDRIVFSSDRVGNDEIWTMRPDGTGLLRLTRDPSPDWEPSWSPDGTRVAFQSKRAGTWDIYVLAVATGDITRVTRDPARDWQPNWGPDGRIAFQSQRGGTWDIYVTDPDGTDVRGITTDHWEDTDPSWSPDGHSIVFSSDRGGTAGDIWVVSADVADGSMRVTSGGAYEGAPSWSPDGTRIAFESDRNGALDVCVVRAP